MSTHKIVELLRLCPLMASTSPTLVCLGQITYSLENKGWKNGDTESIMCDVIKIRQKWKDERRSGKGIPS